MKRKILSIICMVALLCASLASCESQPEYIDDNEAVSELEADGEYQNGDHWFLGEVLEVSEGSILVKPHKNAAESKSADKISVSTSLKEGYTLPRLQVGSIVRVVYDGAIAESYPA